MLLLCVWLLFCARYEMFPYPPVPVASTDTFTPIVLQSPSNLVEINHYLHGGHFDWCEDDLRILVAGGGTGEKTMQIALQVRTL